VQQILEQTHPEWHAIIELALKRMDQNYLLELAHESDWLPGITKLLAAFSLPLSETRYLLLGESPYPRALSANGYAFWDNAVGSLWSETGLSKAVNRATSLRNIMKMLLLARGDLGLDLSQTAITQLDKSKYIQTGEELFNTLINKGFLLLNATLVYSDGKVRFHARHWQPFMHSLFSQLLEKKPAIQLILLGKIANEVPNAQLFPCLIAEHPYNLSFITNTNVLDFFKPLDLLNRHAH
jgi:uracil-DNA glycosylase